MFVKVDDQQSVEVITDHHLLFQGLIGEAKTRTHCPSTAIV
jgi:hypothetical protein